MAETILARAVGNGHVHKMFREPGVPDLASFEGDNLDSATALSVMTDTEITEIDLSDLCRRCFPTDEAFTAFMVTRGTQATTGGDSG